MRVKLCAVFGHGSEQSLELVLWCALTINHYTPASKKGIGETTAGPIVKDVMEKVNSSLCEETWINMCAIVAATVMHLQRAVGRGRIGNDAVRKHVSACSLA